MLKELLKSYLGKKVTLVLKQSNGDFFLDCVINEVSKDSVQVNWRDGIQIVPFDSIVRVEVKTE